MTILLTTHYLEEADRLASQLAIVDRGRIVARGTPDALKSELRGDTIQVELANGDGPRPPRPRSSGCPRRARWRWTGSTLRARGGRRRRRGAGRARGAAGERGARGGGHARAALIGRRVPALRRPDLGGGGMTALRQTWQVAPALPARDRAAARVPLHRARAADHLAAAVRRAVQGGDRDPRLRRRLLHRLPHPRRRRDARRVERGLDRDGVHRRHQRRRDGPHARRAGVAGRAEPRERRPGRDPDPGPDARDRAARAGRSARTTRAASAAC